MRQDQRQRPRWNPASLAFLDSFCPHLLPGFLGWLVVDGPNPQELTASRVEIAAKVYELKSRKGPRQIRMLTVFEEERDDSLGVPRIVERKQEFVFHPPGTNGIGSQNDEEPITVGQGTADFVMPLLRSCYVSGAIPIANAVPFEHSGETHDKPAIFIGMGEEYLFSRT